MEKWFKFCEEKTATISQSDSSCDTDSMVVIEIYIDSLKMEPCVGVQQGIWLFFSIVHTMLIISRTYCCWRFWHCSRVCGGLRALNRPTLWASNHTWRRETCPQFGEDDGLWRLEHHELLPDIDGGDLADNYNDTARGQVIFCWYKLTMRGIIIILTRSD